MAAAGAAGAVVAAEVALALARTGTPVAGGAGVGGVAHGALASVVDGAVVRVGGVVVPAAAAEGAGRTVDGVVDGVGHQGSPRG